MTSTQSAYALTRQFHKVLRRRRGVTVKQCAAAMGCSVSTWYNHSRKAALGLYASQNKVVASIEAAHTPPLQDTPRPRHSNGPLL